MEKEVSKIHQEKMFQGISGMLKHKPAWNELKFISQYWNNCNLQKRSWLILEHNKIKYIPTLQHNIFIFIYSKITVWHLVAFVGYCIPYYVANI